MVTYASKYFLIYKFQIKLVRSMKVFGVLALLYLTQQKLFIKEIGNKGSLYWNVGNTTMAKAQKWNVAMKWKCVGNTKLFVFVQRKTAIQRH